MELKVNIDKSTHQIMCSINETTTIQDMIVALAHALQQTGQFYLIEKTDSDERVVSPNEKPYDLYQYYCSIPFKVDLVLKKLDDTDNDVTVEEDTKHGTIENTTEICTLESVAHADLYNIISVQQNRLSSQNQRLDAIYQEILSYENSTLPISPLPIESLIERSDDFLQSLNEQQSKLKAKISEFKHQLKMNQTFLKFIQSHIKYLDVIHDKTKEVIQYEQVIYSLPSILVFLVSHWFYRDLCIEFTSFDRRLQSSRAKIENIEFRIWFFYNHLLKAEVEF